MKITEKVCPACAELVNVNAVICKHCRYEFSTTEIESAQRKATEVVLRRKIDKQLKEYYGVDALAELKGFCITRLRLLAIAGDLKCESSQVEVRVNKLSMSIDEDWTEEKVKLIDVALFEMQPLEISSYSEIADQFGVNPDHVFERAQELEIPMIDRKLEQLTLNRAKSRSRFISIMAVISVITIGAIILFSVQNYSIFSSNVQVDQTSTPSESPNPTPETAGEPEIASDHSYPPGMSAQNKKDYDSMSPEAKEVVNKAIAIYDTHCGRNASDC